MKYMKRPKTIEAVKYVPGLEDGFVEHLGKMMPYINLYGGSKLIVYDDDYIIMNGLKDRQCVPGDVFESKYMALPEDTEND